jgi:hypothetical protein
MDGALPERRNVRLFGFFAGESVGLLGGCRRAAGVSSVFLSVDQLQENVEHEVASEDANREKNGEGHGGLARANLRA